MSDFTTGGGASFFDEDYTDYAYDSRHTASHDPGVVLLADQPAADTDSGVGANHQLAGTHFGCIGGQVAWKTKAPECGYMGDNIYSDGLTGLNGTISELGDDWRRQSWVRGEE